MQTNDPKYIIYHPYRLLISNKDTSNKQYPITFENKVMKGCIVIMSNRVFQMME
jgi:hypothetical protein